MTLELAGLTWAHTRGFAPLATLGRVWEDHHPGERVRWEARSLRSFGEEPLAAYLDDYDLLVFDYPFAGEALEHGWVLPLADLLPAQVLDDCCADTISPLYDAFTVDGRQAALPIDVATHVAASRPDLLDRRGEALPATWEETVDLARRTRLVAMPLRPTGVWGAFLTLCAAAGAPAFKADAGLDLEVAADAIGKLQALAPYVDPWCTDSYPVALLNRLAGSEEWAAFVPLTYGYCTYGHRGYAAHRLRFHDPRLGPEARGGAILGGAGIGVSGRSRHPREAAAHAAWLVSREIQTTLYVAAGGQPAHAAAWHDPQADALTNGFFSGTRASALSAYVRPNRAGFHGFQNFAAGRLHRAVLSDEAPRAALEEVAQAWRRLPPERAGTAP